MPSIILKINPREPCSSSLVSYPETLSTIAMSSINPTSAPRSITLHGRTYLLPQRPTVVICVDGFDPSYLTAGITDGILPTLATFVASGFHATAKCVMPSVTNPNNTSIITGAPTSVHGLSTNWYFDKKTGEEHMIVDDTLLRGSTILAEMASTGVRVAAITAKDKLRRIINRGLSTEKKAICFSAQHADQATLAENGIENVEAWLGRPTPPQYSGELSLFVIDAGLKLLREDRADLFYLTLSDYIQHKHAPRSTEANAFMQALDGRIGEFVKLGAIVAVTGDHGMSDKSDETGAPNVLYLEDELHRQFPASKPRVICPINDSFTHHHGALGGLVQVYLRDRAFATEELIQQMLAVVRKFPEVEVAYTGAEAASTFDSPPEYEGDIVVVGVRDAVVGSRRDEHDLKQLGAFRLRSHGSLAEQGIPLLRSEALVGNVDPERSWRNFDAFDIALNH